MYSKSPKKNHQKCFFFISQPILIWFALSGRAKLGTLNFYTELWDFTPLINYGNLCKFIPKIKKIASSPSFLYRFSFCLFYLIGLGGGFKTCVQNLKFINYANLCKFIQNHKKMLRTSFLNPFWFGLLYLIELIGGFKICTQNSFANLFKITTPLLHLSTDFYLVCFIW